MPSVPADAERRDRYAAAVRQAGDTAYGNRPFYEAITDAVITVADAEQAALRDARRFLTRVMEIFSLSHADSYGDLFWRVDDGKLKLYANVSDVFAWGSADTEPITPGALIALERAYADLKAVNGEDFTATLYAARQRGQRPQGAAYPSGAHASWREVSALYDGCGPERALGIGNPRPAPVQEAELEQQAADADLRERYEAEASPWYEVINPRNATTSIALVHDNGELYLPEGPDALTVEEFHFAAARGKAYRLMRVDEAMAVAQAEHTPEAS
ncbi:hypothetical protein AB0I46_23220 [Streptomyces spectabilis]|uniref:hypothetical protein n=1 Tax=Streptomyces spectabilis TaxID=68270 RepID=UPI0034080A1E